MRHFVLAALLVVAPFARALPLRRSWSNLESTASIVWVSIPLQPHAVPYSFASLPNTSSSAPTRHAALLHPWTCGHDAQVHCR